MSKESIEKLSSVIKVLENIEVKGKSNLLNLGGCIAVLEEIRKSVLVSGQKDAESKEE